MPPFYSVRVTTEDTKWVVEKLLKGKKTICCSEVGGVTEKPHVHFILFESKSTVWRRLQQAGYTGNGCFAFTEGKDGEHDVQNEINYICKGECLEIPPVILVNTMGFTGDQILQFQRDYWAHALKVPDSSTPVGSRANTGSGKRESKAIRHMIYAKFMESEALKQLVWWNTTQKSVYDADRLCYRVHLWLIETFRFMDELQDLPMHRKYVIFLVLKSELLDSKMVSRLWLNNLPGTQNFFLRT